MGYIYRIYNDINDKNYIGKTTYSIEHRFKEHCKDSSRRKLEHRPLYAAMRKYGVDHFYVEEIEQCDNSQLANREIYWIEYYHSYSNGYNATFGGDGKILYDYNILVNDFLTGLTVTEVSNKHHCSIEVVRNALRNANVNTYQNVVKKNSRPVIGLFPNGEQHIFESMSEAGRWLVDNGYTTSTIKNISSSISRVALHKAHRHTYLGIKWEYYKE